MNPKSITAATILCLLVGGCDKSVEHTAPNNNPSQRTISDALIASCPNPNLAKRSATDTTLPILELSTNGETTVILSIYRQNGSLIVGPTKLPLSTLDTATKSVYFAWEGTDSSGNRQPSGNYFFFYDILDSTNAVKSKDSSCIVLQNFRPE